MMTVTQFLAAAKAELARIETYLGVIGHDAEEAAGFLTPLADAAEALAGAPALIPITNAAGAALTAAAAGAEALSQGNVNAAAADAATAKQDAQTAANGG